MHTFIETRIDFTKISYIDRFRLGLGCIIALIFNKRYNNRKWCHFEIHKTDGRVLTTQSLIVNSESEIECHSICISENIQYTSFVASFV